MAIVTRPSTADYRRGFEDALGRRCILCRKPIDPAHAVEYEEEAHRACEEERARGAEGSVDGS